MPGRIDLLAEEEKRRRLIEMLGGEEAINLGVAPVPPLRPSLPPPTYEMRNSRAYDEAFMSPQEWGPIPPPANPEDAEDEQEEIDRNAGYDLRDRENAEADALVQRPVAPMIDVTPAARTPAEPPPEAVQPAAPISRDQMLIDMFTRQQAAPPKPAPPAAETEKSLTPEISKGKEPDLYGHDSEGGFSREKAMAAAAAAYDRETYNRETGAFDRARPATPGPLAVDELPNPYGEAPSSRWEDEFLASRSALTDDQIRRRAAVIGIFGSPDQAKTYTEREMKMRESYDKGLEAARMKDRGEHRISREEAIALAGTGNISPEAAATLNNNNILRQAYPNGMYSQGLSAERADWMRNQYQLGQLGATQRQREELEVKERIADKDNLARLSIAQIYGMSRGQKPGAVPDDVVPVMARYLSKNIEGYSTMDAIAYLRGDESKAPDTDQETLLNLMIEAKENARTDVGRRNLTPDVAARAAEERLRHTNKFTPGQIKEYGELNQLGANIKRAADAWRAMPQGVQKVFVSVGRDAPEQLKSLGLGDYQVQATDLGALVGEIRRQTLGLAQTVPELHGLAETMGMTAGTFDPFKNPKAFERAMQALWEAVRLRNRLYKDLQPKGD